MEQKEKIISQSSIEVNIVLKLTESEARALNVLPIYGDDSFLRVFYEYLGENSLKKHEKGLISLFKIIRDELPKHLKKADDARNVFNAGNSKH